MKNEKGYILVLSLTLCALAASSVFYISYKVVDYAYFVKTMLLKQNALHLARSGIAFACSQLFEQGPQDDEEDKALSQTQKEIKHIFPLVNHWNHVVLNKKEHGIAGDVWFYITSEWGKIDLNAFDFLYRKEDEQGAESLQEKQERAVLEYLFSKIETIVKGENLFQALERFCKQRQHKLNDITELLKIPEFSALGSCVFPRRGSEKAFFLTDCFTINAGRSKLSPWVFSPSVCKLFGIDFVQKSFEEKRQYVQSIIRSVKDTFDWKSDYDSLLSSYYNVPFQDFTDDSTFLFASDAKFLRFSILVHARVAFVTERVMAVVERAKKSNNAKEKTVIIKHLYWL